MTSIETTGDHLDTSPSETVRRHAATFRRVRLARQAALFDDIASKAAPRAEPHTPAREALPDEVPAPARKLADAAEASGWQVRMVYARGASLTELVTVRCKRGEFWAIGAWRCPAPSLPMKFKWSWAWGVVGNSPRVAGARELLAFVSDASDKIET